MNIGIASDSDIRCFLPFFREEKSFSIIADCCIPNLAPAVNTLIISFLKNGHYVRLFTLANRNFVISGEGIDIYGVRIEDAYPVKYLWGDFINAKNIMEIISQHLDGLEVLHAQWTYSYAYAAKKFTNQLPVFCTVRDWASYIYKMESTKNKVTWSFRRLMNKQVFKSKDIHFIANSPYTAELIKERYKFETFIIPNPIKESFLRNDEYISPINLKILCISSSNDRRKNVKTLLLAFKHLLLKYRDAELFLIGTPFTLEDKIVQQWQHEGLLKQVSLIGSVDHDSLKSYFDQVSMFVTPSLEETFGNTLLEAMARKVPIIGGKNSGAVPYVLQGGKAGFLCDVSDKDELANTIETVYIDSDIAKMKSEWAFQYLKVEYLDYILVNRHLELYKKIRMWN